jgi:phosphopantetheinyl transferase
MGRGAARRMTMVPPATAQVWTASPGVLTDVHWNTLGALLDDSERAKARRFKLQADRHAYVLAHALMRLALAHALDVSPTAIVLSHDSRGKPVLLSPARPDVCFSHSRSRLLVACVVTTLGPVGIDVEPIREGHADFDLLARFVALEGLACQHECAAPAARRFYFLWTALEAFWKAQGTGLASGNARIHCGAYGTGACDIRLEGIDAGAPQARVIPLPCVDGCAIAVALRYPQARSLGQEARFIHAMDGMQLINENPMALPSYGQRSAGIAQPRMSSHTS